MALPDYILVKMINIDGNSCGENISHRCQKVLASDPVRYELIPGQGVLVYCKLVQITSGGNPSWELTTYYMGGGACNGFFSYQLETASADPEGTYCLLVSGTKDCDAGTATVEPSV